ncbi:unnamed protein product, partial [Pocillopora meandrina]
PLFQCFIVGLSIKIIIDVDGSIVFICRDDEEIGASLNSNRLQSTFIAIWERSKGVVVNDTFINHEFVHFILGHCFDGFCSGTSCDLMRIVER